jgi:hypothetical protein
MRLLLATHVLRWALAGSTKFAAICAATKIHHCGAPSDTNTFSPLCDS